MMKLKQILNEKKYKDSDISKYYKQAQKALSELSYAFLETGRKNESKTIDTLLNTLYDTYVKYR